MKSMNDNTQGSEGVVPAEPEVAGATSPSAGEPFLSANADLFVKTTVLQNGLIARATGRSFDERRYYFHRAALLARDDLRHLVPPFVKSCRNLDQFWGWVKRAQPTYEDRRHLIWNGFRPLLDHLEDSNRIPSDVSVSVALASLDAEKVTQIWQRALARRGHDPEGAITLAKSLLETVCKHILDALDVGYDTRADLPKLWSLVSKQLNLAPSQHQEEVFRSILGNCQSVVGNLAAVRNKLGDAHGHGRRPVRPQARHAELAVNLSGSMASFLVATWDNWRRQRN